MHDKDNKPYFKRSLTFDSPTPQESFYFRAAVGKKITKQSEQIFTIDKLNLRLTSDHKGIMREGDQAELLIPLSLPEGRSGVTLEYQW